ncbi:hypothetical protein GCM10011613_01550 [Cellvibrio zantedeschiae]|uniref:DUF1318 domain-containing protein n=1 Tax=Cellvibrio zantedeschiae TaxID=1237077 RepID=A0ABQ3AMZ6_9GAMM|nr:YdbL family protein [Cellvibrio zantedeschiae]GGY61802.1 hypothetical protein GCM10011613_01550 [Cellvibrio zantedeschiae]
MKIFKLIKPVLCAALLVISLPLMAMTLQQAMSSLGDVKAQGLVGEKPDGYLGVVTNSGNADEIVKLINEARLAQYQRLAKDNNIALADVQAMAGQKAIEKTQSGQYIQVNQKWAKKP